MLQWEGGSKTYQKMSKISQPKVGAILAQSRAKLSHTKS